MTDPNFEILKIAAISVGLILFTYMLYISRSQKKKLGNSKDKVKKHWRERL